MMIGVLSLKRASKYRLVEFFQKHCRRFVSDAYIPGMVAPAIERRSFQGQTATKVAQPTDSVDGTPSAPS
jgi:hypothetical protein